MLPLLAFGAALALGPEPTTPPASAPEAEVRDVEDTGKPEKKDGPEVDVTLRINMRGEARTNSGDPADPLDDSWRVLEGVRLGVAVAYGPLKAVAQVQDVRSWGQGTSTLSVDPTTGIHQGYLEMGGRANRLLSGWLRLGRQEIDHNLGRIVGAPGWNPFGQAFDAVRARAEIGQVSLDAAYALVEMPARFSITQTDGTEVAARGRGAHLAFGDLGYAPHPAADLHAVTMIYTAGPTEDELDRDRFYVMPGFWARGDIVKGLSYDIEGYLQRGDYDGLDQRGWMLAAHAQYVAPIRGRPGIGLTYEIFSGHECIGDPADDEPCANTVQRDWDQLFARRHKWRGFADRVGGSNLRDLGIRLLSAPVPEFKITADYHLFQLHARNGRWLTIQGNGVGDGWDPDLEVNTLAHEIDIQLDAKVWKYLIVRPAWTIWIPGPAARRLLPPDPSQFIYLWMIFEI